MVYVRLELAIGESATDTEKEIRAVAKSMNVTIHRVKVRNDTVQLYGVKAK